MVQRCTIWKFLKATTWSYLIYVGCKIFHDLARKKVKDYVIKLENVQPKLDNVQPVSNHCPTEIELELELELNLDIKTEVEAENRELSSKSS